MTSLEPAVAVLVTASVDPRIATLARARAEGMNTTLDALFAGFLLGLAWKPPRARRAKTDDADAPKPSHASIPQALGAVADAANIGMVRFFMPQGILWSNAWIKPLNKLLERFPNVATWRLFGDWLAAGHRDWRVSQNGVLSVPYLLGTNFPAEMAAALQWEHGGRFTTFRVAAPGKQRPKLACSDEDFGGKR